MGEVYVMTEPWLVVSQVITCDLEVPGKHWSRLKEKMIETSKRRWACPVLVSPSLVGTGSTETSAYS